MHVLSTPPAFVLSQDQTLELKSFKSSRFCSYFFCVCLATSSSDRPPVVSKLLLFVCACSALSSISSWFTIRFSRNIRFPNFRPLTGLPSPRLARAAHFRSHPSALTSVSLACLSRPTALLLYLPRKLLSTPFSVFLSVPFYAALPSVLFIHLPECCNSLSTFITPFCPLFVHYIKKYIRKFRFFLHIRHSRRLSKGAFLFR